MKTLGGLLLCSSAIALVPISSATAQTSDAAAQENEDVIVVTGIRASLKASQDIKRDASVIVDAVSAEEVGKFPDNNVAEALQRITGVAIDRSGGEGQFITVRGLGPEFNAVLLNGRTIATDNPGREFSFDVLSSDIIQRAEVFKSSAPNLQSGGIGAVVNVSTARPLDRPGFNATASVAGVYEDLRDEISPEISGVVSWSNDSFGILLGGSYSDRKTQIDTAFTNGFALRDGTVNAGDIAVNAPENSVGLDATALGPIPASRVQQQVVFDRDVQDRERITVNGALQFAPSDRLTLTLDGLYSKFDVQSFATQFSGFFSPPFINPVIDSNGTVTSFSRPSVDFANRNPLIAGSVGLSQNDNVITSRNREAETYVFGGNVEFEATDNLKFVFDISRSSASRDGTNPFVVLGALAPESPLIELPNDNGIPTITNLVGLTDTSIQRLHFVNVNRTRVDDDIWEYRFDGEWAVEKGPLETVTFGALHTDRSKSQDLFDNFAAPGNGVSAAQIFCAYCGYTVPFDETILNPFSFDGFLSGVPGAGSVPPTILNASFADAFRELNNPTNLNDPNRTGGNTAGLLAILADPNTDPLLGIYTPTFNPGGSFSVDEKIYSAYFNTEWGGDFGGDLPWSANIGFRIAFTDVVSRGVDQPVLQFRETPGDTQLEVIFGPATDISVPNDYVNFLPSVNVKVEPTADTVLRLSYAKTVTRPTLTALGVANTFGGRSNAPTSGGGNPFLQAFEADNFDISFEWYFDQLSYFSIAGFHKNLGNFIETATLPVVNPVLFPAGNGGRVADEIVNVTFQDTRDRNGQSGSITGVEIALQKTITGGTFEGLGGVVNYTYVNSQIDDQLAGDPGFNGFTPHTVNVTAFYERGPFQARISYNYRDEFLFLGQSFFSEPQTREAFSQVDFSLGFDVTDNFQVFAEGINIFEEDTRDFSRFPNRLLNYERTGARYTFGVRGKF
ncbi:MAG: TonB-dependent receptor [Parasphingorhabdus sp.]|uniref:TonB-dependent receptor n=1 Tax=Parasphingorhabdus sp. TaxID=2709688 RepID=UPI003298BF24